MKELIGRLEKATGPDRELDALIYCASHGYTFVRFERWNQHAGRLYYKIEGCTPEWQSDGFPLYTSSYDGARTLIPPGLYWHMGEGKTRDDEPLGAASIIAPGSLETISEAEHESAIRRPLHRRPQGPRCARGFSHLS